MAYVKVIRGELWLFVQFGALVMIVDDIFDACDYCLAHFGYCPRWVGDESKQWVDSIQYE